MTSAIWLIMRARFGNCWPVSQQIYWKSRSSPRKCLWKRTSPNPATSERSGPDPEVNDPSFTRLLFKPAARLGALELGAFQRRAGVGCSGQTVCVECVLVWVTLEVTHTHTHTRLPSFTENSEIRERWKLGNKALALSRSGHLLQWSEQRRTIFLKVAGNDFCCQQAWNEASELNL